MGRPHGLEGFLGLYVESTDLGYFEVGSSVFIGDRWYVVRALRQGKKGPQVAFEGVVDRTQADELRGQDVLVAAPRPLEEGEFFLEDLIGLEVRPGGGVVVGVETGAAQDRLVIERGEARFEVPFVEALVPVVDVEAGYIEIVELSGLSEPSG